MDDLADFLRARLAEDQAEAERGYLKGSDDPAYTGWDRTTLGEVPPQVAGRLLREIEAKRRIVARFEEAVSLASTEDRLAAASWRPVVTVLGPVLQDLAAVYADHPDYRPEWAPAP